MAEQWYCRINGTQYGPGSLAQIKKLADSGRLKPDDYIRPASQEQWSRASSLAALWAPTPRTATPLASPAPAPAKPAARPPATRPVAPSTNLGAAAPAPARAPSPPPPRRPSQPAPSPSATPVRPAAPRRQEVAETVVEADLAPASAYSAAPSPFADFSPSQYSAPPAGTSGAVSSGAGPRRKSAAKKTNYWLVSILITIPIVIMAAVGPLVRLASQNAAFLPVEEFLKRDAEYTNKMLPKQLDGGVRFDSMSAGPGRQVTFFYTLTNVEEVDPTVDVNAQARTIKSNMLVQLKSMPAADYYRRNSVELHMKFRDNKKRTIATINIKPSEF